MTSLDGKVAVRNLDGWSKRFLLCVPRKLARLSGEARCRFWQIFFLAWRAMKLLEASVTNQKLQCYPLFNIVKSLQGHLRGYLCTGGHTAPVPGSYLVTLAQVQL